MILVKNAIIKKLGLWLESKITASDIVDVHKLVINFKQTNKVMPYNLIDCEDRLIIGNSLYGKVLLSWCDSITSAIDKDINKGRRMYRELQNIVNRYGTELPFIFGSQKVFIELINIVYLDVEKLNEVYLVDSMFVCDENFIHVVENVKKYIISLVLFFSLLDMGDYSFIFDLIIYNDNEIVDKFLYKYLEKGVVLND